MGWLSLLVSVLFCAVGPAFSGEHSLFYTYTALSQPLKLPGIYEFTALGMLDDRELDYYTSQTQVKVPKQNWMKEKMPQDYWEKGTQSRKSKEQWFKVNVDILMERMRHNKSDLHVLQWRHGCVVNEATDGSVTFVKGVDEYSYDGAEFLSFDEVNSRWIAPVQAAVPTKRKWDEVPILNQYTKGYLEKECVDWLTKFKDYGKEELKKHYPPDVQLFAKKSVTKPGNLILTCLATGFYPKDIEMNLRKSRTSLPEHMVTSSGVRPNGDGTYQLRKSVEIVEEDKARYDCYVNHITLENPIIVPENEVIPCLDCTLPKIQSGIFGGVVGVVLTLAVVACILCVLIKRGKITCRPRSPANSTNVALAETHVNIGSQSTAATMGSDSSSDSGQDSCVPSAKGSPEHIDEENLRLLESDSAKSETHVNIGSQSTAVKKNSDSSSDSGQSSGEPSPGGSQENIEEEKTLLESDSAKSDGGAEE